MNRFVETGLGVVCFIIMRYYLRSTKPLRKQSERKNKALSEPEVN